jgi:putative tRNA adenosine deaminase-associated protein
VANPDDALNEYDEPEGFDADADEVDVSDYDDLDNSIVIDDYDEDDTDDEDEDEDDDYEDATPEEIDFVVAIYREDGEPTAVELAKPLANDLDDLIDQLRRLPGDSGSAGVVSISGEFFVAVKVRGRHVDVLLSDCVSANDWPIARDAADFLGVDIPDEDDDSEPVGDLGIFAEQGLADLDMEAIIGDIDADSDELVRRIMEHIGFGRAFAQVVPQ